jgi:hypothetical protein
MRGGRVGSRQSKVGSWESVRGTWRSLYFRLAGRALVDPALAVALIRIMWRLRDRRWAARFPFLPLPSRDYVRWRMHTVYGDHDAVPPVDDIVGYARWATRSEQRR